jgi:hypothetical protein
MDNEKRKFNNEYLEKIALRDSCVILGNYDDLNRGTRISFTCKCGEVSIKAFTSMADRGCFCIKCKNTIMNEKTKKTNMERFGCEDPNQLDTVKQKIKKIFVEKYGVDSPMKTKEVKEKQKEVMLEKYGVENPFQSEIIKDKIKDTLMEKYGVEHPLQNVRIYKKFETTLMKNHGVDIPYHSEKIKEKGRETCLQRYGVEYAFQSKELREKGKQTCLLKYGVESPNQSMEVIEKRQKNAFKRKEFIMPSGAKYLVQGYEPFAIRDLLKIYNESQIKLTTREIPRILYKTGEIEHYYFPDIFIPHENKIIEVKSTWTIKSKGDNIELKKNACLEQNYLYEIWVYTNKGERLVEQNLTRAA